MDIESDQLFEEWKELIVKAKNLGLTIDDIRKNLHLLKKGMKEKEFTRE